MNKTDTIQSAASGSFCPHAGILAQACPPIDITVLPFIQIATHGLIFTCNHVVKIAQTHIECCFPDLKRKKTGAQIEENNIYTESIHVNLLFLCT